MHYAKGRATSVICPDLECHVTDGIIILHAIAHAGMRIGGYQMKFDGWLGRIFLRNIALAGGSL